MAIDVFCDRKKIKSDILAETENWMVKLGFGIATPGHVMAITKQHFDCLADVSDNLFDEFEQKIHPTLQDYIEERFSQPFEIEYGVFGQTVPHAHLHYIPTKGEGYLVKSVVNDVLLKANVSFESGNRQTLRNVRRNFGRYNLFIENGNYLVCPIPQDISDETSSFLDRVLNYRVFLKLMGGKVPLSWTNRTSEEIERDEVWRSETRKRFEDISRFLH